MKKVSVLLATLIVALLGTALVACGEVEVVSLYCEDHVYSIDEQTIEITVSETDNTGCTFEESISASDLSVGDGLEGKQVTAVEYIDEKTIAVTLSGKVTAEVGDKAVHGYVRVNSGMTHGGTGSAYLYVIIPKMTSSILSSSSGPPNPTYSALFRLPYGSFIEENLDQIEVAAYNGTYKLNLLSETELEVTVNGFVPDEKNKYPIAHFPENVTTFGVEIFAYVGVVALQDNGYPLV